MYRVTSSRAIITLSNIRILAYEISGATGGRERASLVGYQCHYLRYAANHSISRILNLSSFVSKIIVFFPDYGGQCYITAGFFSLDLGFLTAV